MGEERQEKGEDHSNKLLEAALKKHAEGFVVAPFSVFKVDNNKFRKQPLLKRGQLEQWLERGQSSEEVKGLEWEKANAVAIFLREITRDGETLYPFCVDLDMTELSWRPLLRYLPVTSLEKTPRGGLHAFYFSRKSISGPRSVRLENDEKVELLFNKWVLIYPSVGYFKLNDNMPRVVDDGEKVFMDLLRSAGLLEKFDIHVSQETEDRRRLENLLRKVEDVLRPHLAYEGNGYNLYHCVFHPPDSNPSLYLNKRKFYVYDFHSGRSFSLKEFLKEFGNGEEGGKGWGAEYEIKIQPFISILECAGEVEYIVKPFLPKGALILLYGPPGCGKSFVSLDVASKIAAGQKVFDYFDTKQGNVLLVDLENSMTLLKERWNIIKGNGGNVFIINHPAFNLASGKCLELLRKAVSDYDLSLVILDNLTALNPKLNENDSVKMYRMLSGLRRICLDTGASIMIIHHVRKAQMFSFSPLDEIRGSTALAAVPDIILNLTKVQSFYQLKIVKNRVSNVFDAYLLELDEGGFKYLQQVEESFDSEVSQICRVITEIGSQSPGGIFAVSQVYEAVPYGKKSIYRAIQLLQAAGRIRRVKRGVYQLVSQMTLSLTEGGIE